MPQPIELGPFTPGHCTVCRALIPQVEDSNPNVGKWARHLNYMKHLKKYHPEYYKWSKRWTNSLYLPLIPFIILAYFSANERSSFLLLLVTVAGLPDTLHPFVSLSLEKRPHLREAWDLSQSGAKETIEYANSPS